MQNRLIRRLIIVGVLSLVLVALLVADLTAHGLFWRFAWHVTGEEEPIGQLRGVSEWLVSLSRPQANTQPLVPINHTNLNPYGINVFLQQEVEEGKIDAQLQMIAEAGFAWIRQQFEWAEIEVDGRGQFTDSRNDINGDGEPDTIDAWIKFDRIVDLAETHGLQIQARLDNPPSWAHADPAIGAFAPPDDYQDFVNFAAAVAERYKGRIYTYQVWNEPNIYPEWGEQSVNPEAYTELLCRTYKALKAVDPEIVVINGAMAPTISLTGRDLNDFIFLQRMYDAGAGDCFDIVSVQGYGLNSGPTDRRMRPTTVNIARNLYIRDLMVANGDSHKAIWISEAAWNSSPSYDEVPRNPDGSDPIIQRTAFGQVTPEQAAEYMPIAYQRAQEEWPWVGVVNYWFFTRASDAERGQASYYFRMVEPDYNPEREPPFTPLPIYDSMKAYITESTPMLYPGVHQVENHWAIRGTGNIQVLQDETAQFGQAVETTQIEMDITGTALTIRWRPVDEAEWRYTMRSLSTIRSTHPNVFVYSGAEPSISLQDWRRFRIYDGPVVIDSVTVVDRTLENVFGYGVMLLIILILSTLALWDGLSGRGKKST